MGASPFAHVRMCFSCTTRRRKLRAEAAASTYAGGRPGSECAARNERSNERGRGAAGSPEPDALYYTNLISLRGELEAERCREVVQSGVDLAVGGVDRVGAP